MAESEEPNDAVEEDGRAAEAEAEAPVEEAPRAEGDAEPGDEAPAEAVGQGAEGGLADGGAEGERGDEPGQRRLAQPEAHLDRRQ